jgi:hypothetical protein
MTAHTCDREAVVSRRTISGSACSSVVVIRADVPTVDVVKRSG